MERLHQRFRYSWSHCWSVPSRSNWTKTDILSRMGYCGSFWVHYWRSKVCKHRPNKQTKNTDSKRYPLANVFPLFVVLFALFQSFLSVGPGDCNFLVSSESFPTPLRGHFLGFAAAVGKAGAAIGTTVLSNALQSYEDPKKGQQVLYIIGSCISLLGIGFVWFLIPNVSE
jgi:hypothetical protein